MALPNADRFLTELTADLQRALGDAVARGVKGTFNAVGALAAAMAEQTDNPADLKRAYDNVARAMQEAVLDAYDANVEGMKGNEHPGRRNRLTGKLRPALADPTFVEGTVTGINFVNVRLLNSEAAHWRRLNFGTYGIDDSPPFAGRVTDLTINGSVIAPLGFFGEGPSDVMMLPPGFWRARNNRRVRANPDRRGDDRFQPFSLTSSDGKRMKNLQWQPTTSVEPRRFLDAGFEGLAEQFPIEFNRLVQRWLNDDRSSPTSQAFLRNLKVPGGTSRIKNFRTAASVQIRRF